MTADVVKVALLVGVFAAWVTVHVAIAAGLMVRKRWGRGFASLFVPVLAPYFGARAGMGARALAWVGLCAAYVVARVAAS
jgi:hypothetical protein